MDKVGIQATTLMYLITFFFLSYMTIKLLISPSAYEVGHAIAYSVTLQVSGGLCAQMYKDNDQSLLYTVPVFVIVFFLQKLILKNILGKFKKVK